MKRELRVFLFVLSLASIAFAADKPSAVFDWPEQGQKVLHIEIGKFTGVGSVGKQRTYTVDVAATNVWGKPIDFIGFNVYVFDKAKTRIGESYLTIRDLAAGQKTMQSLIVTASGLPATIHLASAVLPKGMGPPEAPKQVSIQVNSSPSGADLKVDGESVGTTPKAVRLTVGHHVLQFTRPGFQPFDYPLDIGPDDQNGGRLDIELGTSAHDTIELRDGSVIAGDILKMDTENLFVRVAGQDQTIPRNRVKRILLVERMPASQ